MVIYRLRLESVSSFDYVSTTTCASRIFVLVAGRNRQPGEIIEDQDKHGHHCSARKI